MALSKSLHRSSNTSSARFCSIKILSVLRRQANSQTTSSGMSCASENTSVNATKLRGRNLTPSFLKFCILMPRCLVPTGLLISCCVHSTHAAFTSLVCCNSKVLGSSQLTCRQAQFCFVVTDFLCQFLRCYESTYDGFITLLDHDAVPMGAIGSELLHMLSWVR